MPESNIHIRKAEIKSLIQTDLDAAASRLLEFARDFAYDDHLVTDSLLLLLDIRNKTNTESDSGAYSFFRTALEQLTRQITVDNESNPGKSRIQEANRKLIEKFQPAAPPENIVETKALCFSYFKNGNKKFSLSDIDLCIRPGEITGLLGENGNGKTTLLRILAGILRPEKGQLSYPSLFAHHPFSYQTLKQQIAYIPQQLDPFPGTLRQSLHFTAAVKGIRGNDNIREVEYIIQRLGLSKYENDTWANLSGGYRMRYSLAEILVWKPKLVILDEPLANLDIKLQDDFLNDLKNLSQNIHHPWGAIISSQHIDKVENIADNIIFLKEGKSKFSGPRHLIGQDRTWNMFELKTYEPVSRLRNALKSLDGFQLSSLAFSYIIYTGKKVTAAHILDILNRHNITIEMFEDISSSAKSLFQPDPE